MEILINELSLNGQFLSAEHFITDALPPMVALLNEIDYTTNSLYKKYDFYQYPVTETVTVHDILVSAISRQYDEIRKFKSQLCTWLLENPYWEESQKHVSGSLYTYNGMDICGHSLAEACERDKVVISFIPSEFSLPQLAILKGSDEMRLANLINRKFYLETAWQQKLISFEIYCNRRFAGTKLDFSRIDSKAGFTLLTKEDEALFLDGFRKFADTSWEKIPMDDALDYKEYNNKNYFKGIPYQIRKFRISRKYRCFGYVLQGVFYVLLFDLEHKLSDKG